jgi:hypothetical protein
MATSFTQVTDANEWYVYGTLDCTDSATSDMVSAPAASTRLMPIQILLSVTTAGAAGDTVTVRGKTSNKELFKMEVGSIKQGRVQLSVEDTKEGRSEEGFIGPLLTAAQEIEITSDSSTAIVWASISGKTVSA